MNPKQIVIIVGPSSHPPGTHEVAAGGRLMKHCLESADTSLSKQYRVDVSTGWPSQELLDRADCLIFIGDIFPPAVMPNVETTMAQLGKLMARGVGLVCIHYATGLSAKHVPDDGAHPLLDWMGGYFATRCKHHQSVARVMKSTIKPGEKAHPTHHGWKEFTFNDEPYFNNYFGKQGLSPNVSVICTSMLPPENPKQEIVGWCIDRPDGGRGAGIVMPHFYKSWLIDDLRIMILNSIVWCTKLEIPKSGVTTPKPNLASFGAQAIEPPAKKKA